METAAAVSIPIRAIQSWDDLRAADFLLLGGMELYLPFSSFHLRAVQIVKNDANPAFVEFELQASQTSDVGSIPIARSISLDDSVAFRRPSR